MRWRQPLSMADQLPRRQLRRLGEALLKGEDVSEAIDAIVHPMDYRWRLRETDSTVVCVPANWFTDGVVDPDKVDPGEAIEISCAPSATGYDRVASANADVAGSVAAAFGPVHGENAAAVARFMSAHLRRPIATMTEADQREFTEFYRRNVWPSDEAAMVVDESMRLTLELARSNDQ
jgi:hypothetical protein